MLSVCRLDWTPDCPARHALGSRIGIRTCPTPGLHTSHHGDRGNGRARVGTGRALVNLKQVTPCGPPKGNQCNRGIEEGFRGGIAGWVNSRRSLSICEKKVMACDPKNNFRQHRGKQHPLAPNCSFAPRVDVAHVPLKMSRHCPLACAVASPQTVFSDFGPRVCTMALLPCLEVHNLNGLPPLDSQPLAS